MAAKVLTVKNISSCPPLVHLVLCAAGRGWTVAPTERAQELDRALIQRLRERCEQQALQLQSLQAQLKQASLCLDVFGITTQHFCHEVGCSRNLGPRLTSLSFYS